MEKTHFGTDYHDHFDPRKYLTMKEKYWEEDRQFHELLFAVKEKGYLSGERLLEIGGGPCINRLITLTTTFPKIVFAEYTEANRKEVQRWKDKDPDAFDWSKHFKYVAELQNNKENWQDLEDELRQHIIDVIPCDVEDDNIIKSEDDKPFDAILIASCLEFACSTHDAYERSVRNIYSLLRPGGTVIHFGRVGGNFYKVGDERFFALEVDEDFVTSAYKKAGFLIKEKFKINEGDKTINDANENKQIADAMFRMLMIAKKPGNTENCV
ncbi:nicotinamide N-methyltransferase-like [Glandiceps talaboti]